MISQKIISSIICLSISLALFSQQNHNTKFIKGYSNNNLEVLDWGGAGTAMVFITGLGNSAHVYDDFAPKFKNNFHVYGITRRGFGKSDRIGFGYSTDTLVLDLLRVLDKLQLKKIVLIGHSISGDEITTFARSYPNRVLATIFLDAAYNHANISELGAFPQAPPPPDSMLLTVDNVIADQRKEMGFNFPAEEITATNNIDAKGILSDDTTIGVAFSKILKFVKPNSFKGIECPSLAIYGKRETVLQRFPAYNYFDSANKKTAQEVMPRWNKYYQTELAKYKSECKNGKVAEIVSGHHYVFLSHPTETEILIRDFLKAL